jgi:hypothetical protein
MFIPDQFALVQVFTSTTGDPDFFANTHGYFQSGAYGQGTADDLSAIWSDFFTLSNYGGASEQYGQSICRYEGLHFIWKDGDDLIAFDSVVDAGAGSGSNSLQTQQVSFLAHKDTDFAGPANRGRFYLPWVAEARVDNVGVVSSSTVTAMQARLDQLLDDIQSIDSIQSEMVLLHATDSLPARTVEQLRMDTTVATQRRRIRR